MPVKLLNAFRALSQHHCETPFTKKYILARKDNEINDSTKV